MTIEADDLAVIQSWCGTTIGDTHATFTAADIEARLDRHGSDVLAVCLEVLRQIHADFLADPASLNFTGDYSQDVGVNLEELRRKIRQLEEAVGDTAGASVVSVSQLSRRTRRR